MKKAILTLCVTLTLGLILFSCGGNSNNNSTATTTAPTAVTAAPSPTDAGQAVFKRTCFACHQADGKGLPNAFPPLAGSDYLLADKFRAVRQVIKGSSGKITVNGTEFNGVMPPQALNDTDIANVLTYVYHSFGNNGFNVSPSEVKSVRDTIK